MCLVIITGSSSKPHKFIFYRLMVMFHFGHFCCRVNPHHVQVHGTNIYWRKRRRLTLGRILIVQWKKKRTNSCSFSLYFEALHTDWLVLISEAWSTRFWPGISGVCFCILKRSCQSSDHSIEYINCNIYSLKYNTKSILSCVQCWIKVYLITLQWWKIFKVYRRRGIY